MLLLHLRHHVWNDLVRLQVPDLSLPDLLVELLSYGVCVDFHDAHLRLEGHRSIDYLRLVIPCLVLSQYLVHELFELLRLLLMLAPIYFIILWLAAPLGLDLLEHLGQVLSLFGLGFGCSCLVLECNALVEDVIVELLA